MISYLFNNIVELNLLPECLVELVCNCNNIKSLTY